jgi:hypothetical protein
MERVERSLTWIVDDLFATPVFALVIASLYTVLAIASTRNLVLIAIGFAFIFSVLGIARSKRLRRRTTIVRFVVTILLIAVLAGGVWRIREMGAETG